ncbi:unnamed protein product [Camellia sinensis]
MVVALKYGDYSELQNTGVYKKYKVDGQDVDVSYFQAYIDGVDFVFVDSYMFHNFESNIYIWWRSGGNLKAYGIVLQGSC